MGSDILNIGKSALNAAQIGISVTGNNIANASSAGYNRQVISQSAAPSQNVGFGYLGKGAQVTSIERVYSAPGPQHRTHHLQLADQQHQQHAGRFVGGLVACLAGFFRQHSGSDQQPGLGF